MNKVKMKNLLVDKGERYGLIAAGGFMLLFMILGVMELSGSPNPQTDWIIPVEKNANDVNKTINSATPGTVKDLPEHIKNPPSPQAFKGSGTNNLFFDPFAPPDKRRVNPAVLALTGGQADYITARILSHDIRIGPGGVPLLGVLIKQKSKDANNNNQMDTKFLDDLRRRYGKGGPRNQNPPPMGNGGLGQGAAPPGAAQPGMPQQGKRAGAPRREGGALVDEGERMGIQYLPFDSEKLKEFREAWTIYPQRMVIIQAALPYKAQIEVIQNALRLQDPNDVFTAYRDETIPLFRGFVVQRQVLSLVDGKIEEDWADLDVDKNYREISRRHVNDQEESPNTNYLLLPFNHYLVTPLPVLVGDKYPEIRIPELLTTIEKQKALNNPPEVPKAPSQFDDNSNIFNPVTPSNTGGQPNLGREGINIARPPAPREGDPAKAVPFKELPEFKLVRIVDNDISPGRLYKYRIKIKMQNPNWVGVTDKKTDLAPNKYKYDLVSTKVDADKEVIESPWTEVKDTVSVPRENFLFAVDPLPDPKDAKGRWLTPLKEGQGLLQVQRWLPNIVAFGNNKEPVGDWVVADLVATRGTYLGGKQFVNLPLWSSEKNGYTLRRVAPERGRKEDRFGVETDPTKPGPRFAVVEVDGGLCEYKPVGRSITLKEETAPEIMLMDETGSLQVRSAYADRFDQARAGREEAWKAWIERTEQEKPAAPATPVKDFN